VQCAEQAERASDLRQQGQLVEAESLFEGCARDACPRVVREDCRTALLELHQTAPRLTVHVRDEDGADVLDARVTLDGAPLSADDCARGIVVNPGRHRVRAERAPFLPREESLVVNLGDRNPTVTVALLRARVARVEAGAPSKNRTPAVVVGASSLAFLAAFGVLGTWTLVDYKNLENTCGARCTSDQVDPARTRGVVADVSLGVGVAGLAVATVLWLTASPSSTEPRSHAPAAAVLAW